METRPTKKARILMHSISTLRLELKDLLFEKESNECCKFSGCFGSSL